MQFCYFDTIYLSKSHIENSNKYKTSPGIWYTHWHWSNMDKN